MLQVESLKLLSKRTSLLQPQFSNIIWKSVFLGAKETLVNQGVVLHSALFHLLKQL